MVDGSTTTSVQDTRNRPTMRDGVIATQRHSLSDLLQKCLAAFSFSDRSSLARTCLVGALLGIAAFVSIVLWAINETGSIRAAFAYIEGDSVYASSEGPIVPLAGGDGKTGSTRLTFLNLSKNPVRIVGYDNPCSCVKIRGLPIEVAPHQKANVLAEASVSEMTIGTLRMTLLTDVPGQNRVSIVLEIVPKAD